MRTKQLGAGEPLLGARNALASELEAVQAVDIRQPGRKAALPASAVFLCRVVCRHPRDWETEKSVEASRPRSGSSLDHLNNTTRVVVPLSCQWDVSWSARHTWTGSGQAVVWRYPARAKLQAEAEVSTLLSFSCQAAETRHLNVDWPQVKG
jgi:hypothetical protein